MTNYNEVIADAYQIHSPDNSSWFETSWQIGYEIMRKLIIAADDDLRIYPPTVE
jgi:hypothetical protein